MNCPRAVDCRWRAGRLGRVAARGDCTRHCRPDQRHHAMALAQPGRTAALAPSPLDIPTRPEPAAKAGPILDLYQRRWKGGVLGPRDYVLCTDEKTSIQARRRTHRSLPPAPGRPAYVEHEYARKGAWDTSRPGTFIVPSCSGSASTRRDRSIRAPRRAGHAPATLPLRSPSVLDCRQISQTPRKSITG